MNDIQHVEAAATSLSASSRKAATIPHGSGEVVTARHPEERRRRSSTMRLHRARFGKDAEGAKRLIARRARPTPSLTRPNSPDPGGEPPIEPGRSREQELTPEPALEFHQLQNCRQFFTGPALGGRILTSMLGRHGSGAQASAGLGDAHPPLPARRTSPPRPSGSFICI